jgi:hypothetical protein
MLFACAFDATSGALASVAQTLPPPQYLSSHWFPSSSDVSLSWFGVAPSTSTTAVSYRIYRGPSTDQVSLVATTSGTYYTDHLAAAVPDTTLVYEVAAVDASGEGARAVTYVPWDDGVTYYVTARTAEGPELAFAQAGGGSLTILQRTGSDYDDATVSPDRFSLLFSRKDAVTGNWEVWGLGANGANSPTPAPVLSGDLDWSEPAWAPDSRAFVATGTSRSPAVASSGLYLSDPQGAVVSAVHGGQGLAHASYGGGTWLVASDTSSSSAPLVRLDLTNGQRTTLAGTAGARLPAVSPDGTQVAYASGSVSPKSLRVLALSSGASKDVPLPGELSGTPAWSRDGAWIFAPVRTTSGSTTTIDLWRVHSDGSGLNRVTNTGEDETSVAANAPDTLPPVVDLSAAPPFTGPDMSVTFRAVDSGTLPEQMQVTCQLDGEAAAPCASPVSLQGLAPGQHSFTVVARDAAYNVTTKSTVWTVDTSGLVVPRPAVRQLTGGGLQVTFKGSGPDLVSYDVRQRVGTLSGGFGAYSPAASATTATNLQFPALPDHIYCFSVRARDGSGNTSPWSPDSCLAVAEAPTHELHGPSSMPVLVTRSGLGALGFTTYVGTSLASPTIAVGSGWLGMTALVLPGDLDGNGVDDIVARDTTGRLWLYPRSGAAGGAGWMPRRQIGSGWQGFSAIVAAPDITGDGHPELLARDGAGRLWLYPTNGRGGWFARRQIGTGWQGFTAILAPGDVDGDGNADVLARDAVGRLWLYPTNGRGGWLARRQVGSGWQGFNALLTTGDFDADGHPDVVARSTDGRLWLYRGNGRSGWLGRLQLGTGWAGFNPIL